MKWKRPRGAKPEPPASEAPAADGGGDAEDNCVAESPGTGGPVPAADQRGDDDADRRGTWLDRTKEAAARAMDVVQEAAVDIAGKTREGTAAAATAVKEAAVTAATAVKEGTVTAAGTVKEGTVVAAGKVKEGATAVAETVGEHFDKVSGATILARVEERIEIQDRYNDILATKLEEALARIAALERRLGVAPAGGGADADAAEDASTPAASAGPVVAEGEPR